MSRLDHLAGHDVGDCGRVAELAAEQLQGTEAADNRERLVAVGTNGVGGRPLAIVGSYLGVDLVPGNLQQPAEDRVAGGLDDIPPA